MTDASLSLPPGHAIWFDRKQMPSMQPKWFDPAYWRAQNALTGEAMGRGTTYFFSHKGRQYVLRHYRRGGLIGKLVKDRYLFTQLHHTRPWRELKLLNEMAQLGLPAPRAVAAQVIRKGLFYRADLICERIEDAQDVHNLLLNGPVEATVWQDIGSTIRRFHDYQVYHHDLNIHNIMRDINGQIWLIDFDRCDRRKGQSWKRANLDRLLRSLNKEKGRCPSYFFKPEDWQNLKTGYEEKKAPR